MTSSSVWVLKHLLCAYCVPSNQNEQHSPHVSHCPKTHTRLSSFNLYSHPGRCAGRIPWTEEETEAPEVE